jgi:hypothetical protein
MRNRVLLALTFLLSLATRADFALAAESEIGAGFFISKSENKNQVHFAVKVDERCAPVGAAPVRPYWRVLERGPAVTEPLSPLEQPAYGIARQTVTSREAGGAVQIVLRAYPRAITLTTSATPRGECASVASTLIDGHHAVLLDIHLVLRSFGVLDYMVLRGTSKGTGRPVREIVRAR